MDDVSVMTAAGRCVCLRCYARESGTVLSMPDWLRREVSAVLANVSVG
jgi:hypothetical protein